MILERVGAPLFDLLIFLEVTTIVFMALERVKEHGVVFRRTYRSRSFKRIVIWLGNCSLRPFRKKTIQSV